MKHQSLWLCSLSILFLHCAANPILVTPKDAKPDEALIAPHLTTRDLQGPTKSGDGAPKSSISVDAAKSSGIENHTSIRKRYNEADEDPRSGRQSLAPNFARIITEEEARILDDNERRRAELWPQIDQLNLEIDDFNRDYAALDARIMEEQYILERRQLHGGYSPQELESQWSLILNLQNRQKEIERLRHGKFISRGPLLREDDRISLENNAILYGRQ